MGRIGVALNAALLGARAFGGGILFFLPLVARAVTVQLDQLGKVHVGPERAFYGFQVGFVAVCG